MRLQILFIDSGSLGALKTVCQVPICDPQAFFADFEYEGQTLAVERQIARSKAERLICQLTFIPSAPLRSNHSEEHSRSNPDGMSALSGQNQLCFFKSTLKQVKHQ